jgi:hypothetical protein
MVSIIIQAYGRGLKAANVGPMFLRSRTDFTSTGTKATRAGSSPGAIVSATTRTASSVWVIGAVGEFEEITSAKCCTILATFEDIFVRAVADTSGSRSASNCKTPACTYFGVSVKLFRE